MRLPVQGEQRIVARAFQIGDKWIKPFALSGNSGMIGTLQSNIYNYT